MTADEIYRQFARNPESTATLNALITTLHDDSFRLARRLLGDDAAAEDALQNAYLGLVKGAGRFDKGRPFRPWWITILLNAIRKEGRRRSRTPRRPSPATAHQDSAAARLEDQLTRRRLREEIQRLPPRLQSPLVLHYFEGRSHAQVAAALELPKSTASSRIQKGLETLRARLKRSGYAALAAGLEGPLKQLARRPITPARPPTGASLLSITKTASIAQAKGALIGLLTAVACLACLAVSLRSETPRTQSSRQQETRASAEPSPAPIAAPRAPEAPADIAPAERAASTSPSPPKAPSQPAPAPSQDLLITVRDPEGKPCAGARLAFVTRSIYGDTELSFDDLAFAKNRFNTTAATDSSGSYRWRPKRNPTQRVCVLARAGQLQTSSPWLDCADLGSSLELALRGPDQPAPGRANLTLRFSARGIPFVGKELSGYLARSEPDGLILGGQRVYRRTDSRGEILIQDLSPGRYSIEFDHPTGLQPLRGIASLAADELVVLELDSDGDIIEAQGRVSTDHQQEPTLALEVRSKGQRLSFDTGAINGRYRLILPRLEPGTYTLRASAGCCSQERPLTITEAERIEGPDFELRCSPARVRGRLLTPDRRPIPGAGVVLYPRGSSRQRNAPTDAQGRFSIAGLSAGRHRLRVYAQIESGTAWHTLDQRSLELPSGDHHLGDLIANRLGKLGSISIEVRDSRGRPIPEAAVQGTLLKEEVREARSDDRGIAELRYLPAGRWLFAARSSAGLSEPVLVRIQDGQPAFAELTIKDQPESSLSGQLLFEGQPAPGLEIELAERLPEELRPAITSRLGNDQGQPPLGITRARSDRRGRFRFPPLRAGTYDLSVGAYKRSIIIAPGPRRLTIEMAQQTGKARLRVRGLARPRGVAWVEARIPDQSLKPLTRRLLIDGEAAFDRLRPITHGLGFELVLESGQRFTFGVTRTIQEAAETLYEIDLSPANTGSAILHLPPSDEPRRVELTGRSATHIEAQSRMSSDDSVRFDHLPAGTYTVFIWSDGARSSSSSEELTIIPGQTTELRLTR